MRPVYGRLLSIPADEATGLAADPILLYLDQNYLSGMVKAKPGFRELEPVLREAVARGVVAVPESEIHRLESSPRPDLPLLDLLGQLSGGLALPPSPSREYCLRRLRAAWASFPGRRSRRSDLADLAALAAALPVCQIVTCDAFMADLVRRSGLDVLYRCQIYTGRRRDVDRLRRFLEELLSRPTPP